MIFISGCDFLLDSEEGEKQYQKDVINVLMEMDQVFNTDIPVNERNRFNNILLPDSLNINPTGIVGGDSTLVLHDEMDILRLFFEFNYFTGTFSYVNETWSYNPNPNDSTIIKYDASDANSGTVSPIKLIFIKSIFTSTQLFSTFELWVNNEKITWINADIKGSDFTTPETIPTLTNVYLVGTTINNAGHNISYKYDISNSSNIFELTVDDNPPVIFTHTADSFFVGLNMEPDIKNMTIEYRNLSLFIDKPNEIENGSGDVGDVLLDYDKMGDLVVIDNIVFLEFPDGKQENLKTLIPSFYNYMENQ